MQQPALTHSDLDHPEHEGLAGDQDWAVGVEAVDVDTPSNASAPNLMQIDTGATPRPSITTGCCVKGRAKGLFQVRDAEGQADTDHPENPYITKLNEMKEEGLADALRADKGALFDFADHRMFGMLKNTVRDTVRVEHKGDWFDAAFLKLHTTPLLHEITEAMYEVFLYRKEDMIRHTGIRFHSAKANKSFLFDVQSFGVDRTYTPVFREEPEKPFKYKPIGHVFLSKGLLSLLSQIKSQKYGRTNNCRDGFMATIVICQFWNASLGIPQALEIDRVLEFIRETIKEDHRYFDKFCCGYTDKKAEEKRKEIQDLTDELSKTSHYDQTLEKMRKLDLIADSTVPPLFVLHKHEEEEATGDSGVPLPPAGEYDADNDAGQPLPE